MSAIDSTIDPAGAIIKSLRDVRDRDPSLHRMVPDTEPRTLALIGSSRAGKSTIVKVLGDSLYRPPGPQLYSATRQPEQQWIGGLQIVDMPGFYDKQKHLSSLLTNEAIFEQLQNVMSTVSIDLYAFVFSLINGINDEDIQSMLVVKEKLPHLSERMMLVVTHCEELYQDQKNDLIKDFFNHPDVVHHDLRKFFKQGTFFIGCIRYESLKQQNRRAITFEHTNVLQMRDLLLDKCLITVPNTNNNNQQTVTANNDVTLPLYQQGGTHHDNTDEQTIKNSSFGESDCCFCCCHCLRTIFSCGKTCLCCFALCLIGCYYVVKMLSTASAASVPDEKIAD
ncbi:unnamed protein product [Adineta steineri]|uniref:G domain-containing protein n=1 Tax=Adineta steineri TaxID=433720 RepID=A0A815RWS3_9BILA|nr:unnamed protein product [Adineta steineri]CAF1482486.1 unnamed protein product [Adineta steineri]